MNNIELAEQITEKHLGSYAGFKTMRKMMVAAIIETMTINNNEFMTTQQHLDKIKELQKEYADKYADSVHRSYQFLFFQVRQIEEEIGREKKRLFVNKRKIRGLEFEKGEMVKAGNKMWEYCLTLNRDKNVHGSVATEAEQRTNP